MPTKGAEGQRLCLTQAGVGIGRDVGADSANQRPRARPDLALYSEPGLVGAVVPPAKVDPRAERRRRRRRQRRGAAGT
jgi:hypothetical protein